MKIFLETDNPVRPLPRGLLGWALFIAMGLTLYGYLLDKRLTDIPLVQAPPPLSDIPVNLDLPLDRILSPLNREIVSVGLIMGTKYDAIITRVADRYHIDPNLIKAMIMAESSYNPRAVSKKGAKGLMQLMPRTAKAMGVKDCFNPAHNIEGGVRYFRKLLNQFDGNIELALAAYNAGRKKVLKYKGIPPYKATRAYIQKVDHYYHKYYSLQAAGGLSRA